MRKKGKVCGIGLGLCVLLSGMVYGSIVNAAEEAEYAFVIKPLSNQFWSDMQDGILEEAGRLGVKVDVYGANTEEDVEGQVTLMENVISKGYKAICVAPITSENLVQPIAEATKKGIYVVNIDEKVNLEALKGLEGAIYSFVASDNDQIGRLGGEYIAKQLGEAGGEVAVIAGKAGNPTGEARCNGAIAAMEEAGLEVVDVQPADYDRTKAYDVTTNYISKHPELKAIYCGNDTMALGAVEAAKKAGREDIIIVGTDGNEDAVTSIEAGELAATVAQDPGAVGARALQLMLEVVEKGEAIDIEAEPVSEAIPAYLIAKEE